MVRALGDFKRGIEILILSVYNVDTFKREIREKTFIGVYEGMPNKDGNKEREDVYIPKRTVEELVGSLCIMYIGPKK